jgi:glycosyltransferase involved in cell wall biosynthesis
MNPRRVLLVHNFYRHRGGEDAAVEAQQALLAAAGWDVGLYAIRSDDVAKAPLAERLERFVQVPWPAGEARRFRRTVEAGRWPRLHFHNLSPFLGPAVAAAAPEGVRTFMTVHNFRLLCINGLFLRDGKPCEACPQHGAWNGVLHRCHEHKLGQSVALTLAQWTGRYGAQIQRRMDRYLFPSGFHLQKHLTYGFPPERVLHVPNFVEDPGASGPATTGPGLYLGRYSQEKGVEVLVKALQAHPLPFVFAGSGPLEAWVREACAGLPGVQVLGWQDADGVRDLMRQAAYVALPSVCYENQPLVALQALGHGLPLLVSDLGGLPELGVDGVNGLRAAPGDIPAWSQALQAMQAAGDAQRQRWGQASRAAYEAAHTPLAHRLALEKAYLEVAA